MAESYTKSHSVTHSMQGQQTAQKNTGSITVESDSFAQLVVSNSFTGERNPNWVNSIKAKSNATTIASGVRRDVSIRHDTQHIKWRENDDTFSRWDRGYFAAEWLYEVTSIDGPTRDTARNEALNRFLRKCKDTQRQFQSGVFLGELRQTIHLVRHPLQGLRKLFDVYVQRVRTGRRLRGREQLQHIASQHLELQFGALPLISDVENGVKALVRIQHKRFVASVSAFSAAEAPLESQSFIRDLFAGRHRVERYISFLCSRKIKGQVYCQGQGGISEIQQSLGATLMDFVPTMYELIPYSFLVDYFSNLGQIIESASFLQSDLAWFTDTTRNEGRCEVRIIPIAPKTFFGLPIVAHSMVPTQSYYRYRNFSRSAQPLGLPFLAFKLPGTSMKFLNIAALASMRAL